MDHHRINRATVKTIAGISRCIVFALQVVVNLIPDHAAKAFSSPISKPHNSFDSFLRLLFDGFHKWDARYILYVAEYGYTSENTFAFFPLYPISVRFLASVLQAFCPFLSFHTCCLVAGTGLNSFLFIGAAIALYDLTLHIFNDHKFAFISSLVFSFNPASIFFSSCYTESMFAFCVFKALVKLHNTTEPQVSRYMMSSLWLMLASLTRSNGTINVGFILYYCASCIVQDLVNSASIKNVAIHLIRGTLSSLFVISPFIIFNTYGYVKFCGVNQSLDVNCSARPKWCCNTPPSVYNHIQNYNWGLGLFAYYKIRKIPNFFLVAPMICLSLQAIYKYIKFRSKEIMYLGLPFPQLVIVKPFVHELKYLTCNIFCYIVHLSFIAIFGLLFMHVEVLTRLIASGSPLPFWFIASCIYRDLRKHDEKYVLSCTVWFTLSSTSKALIVYSVSYTMIGTLLHVNFLPWT